MKKDEFGLDEDKWYWDKINKRKDRIWHTLKESLEFIVMLNRRWMRFPTSLVASWENSATLQNKSAEIIAEWEAKHGRSPFPTIEQYDQRLFAKLDTEEEDKNAPDYDKELGKKNCWYCNEYSQYGDSFETMNEHLTDHLERDWDSIGESGQKRWTELCIKLETARKGKELFNYAYYMALYKGYKLPLDKTFSDPQFAVQNGLIDLKIIERDLKEVQQESKKLLDAWNSLTEDEKKLWQ
ncbi:hypothetical protein HY605_03520, partial [Candidatus Peregrinibacteria bacterium]|nr:hypothetical protein [Candidatus Peregrinibacteria bacterium]